MKNLNQKIVFGFLTIALTANAAFAKDFYRSHISSSSIEEQEKAHEYALKKSALYRDAQRTLVHFLGAEAYSPRYETHPKYGWQHPCNPLLQEPFSQKYNELERKSNKWNDRASEAYEKVKNNKRLIAFTALNLSLKEQKQALRAQSSNTEAGKQPTEGRAAAAATATVASNAAGGGGGGQ